MLYLYKECITLKTLTKEQELKLCDEVEDVFAARELIEPVQSSTLHHEAHQKMLVILSRQTTDRTKQLTRLISYIAVVPIIVLMLSYHLNQKSINLYAYYGLIVFFVLCFRILLDIAWNAVSKVEAYWTTRFKLTALALEVFHKKYGHYPELHKVQYIATLFKALKQDVLLRVAHATIVSTLIALTLPVFWHIASYTPSDVEMLSVALSFIAAFGLFASYAASLMYLFTGRYIKYGVDTLYNLGQSDL